METEALEALLYGNPDDKDAMLVYADHLARAGDPRGQLIGLCAQLADAKEIAHLLATHDLFGPLGNMFRHRRVKHRWGFVKKLRINLDEIEAARVVELLEHPAARFATELELVGSHSVDWAIELVASLGRPRAMRKLVLSGPHEDPTALFARFPYLVAIEIG